MTTIYRDDRECPFPWDASYRSLDVGFDMRAQGIHAILPEWNLITIAYSDENGPAIVHGSREQVSKCLARAGFIVVHRLTPNGREMRCSPPHGLFSVQPRLDNYWVTAWSEKEAMKKSGWKDKD